MTEELVRLKEQIRETRSHRRARYPDHLRQAVLEQLAQWRVAGRPRAALAKMLELDPSTLAVWEKTESRVGSPKVKPVRIVEPKPTPQEPGVVAVIVLPGGARIETMTAAAAAEIAKALVCSGA